MNIFLRYEITARELDANILTGLVAASRGHRAIVCDWPMMMRGILLRRRESGFVHMNSLTPAKSALIFHRIFKFFGYRISSMDQEAGIQLTSYEEFAEIRFGKETVSAADLIFCWGRDDYETLQQLYPECTKKIVMSGSPRVDLWRPKFSSVYVKPKSAVEPFVLVVSTLYGPLLFSRLHERLMSRRRSGYFDLYPERESQLIGQHKEGAELLIAYLDLVRSLSLKHPHLAIIVKPHPAENPEIWRGILPETDSIRVNSDTPTSQLIRESTAVISSGSTVSFEAEVAEKPLISFQPIKTPHRNLAFADSLGIVAETVEEVDTIISEILNPEYQKNLKSVRGKSRVDINQKVHFEDEQLAAERMVNSWERALKRDSHRPASGSIFSMPHEDLKHFVASAFPSLIPRFARKGSISVSTGLQKNTKRPPLERKLVRARLEEMRSILGLQNSVSYRFKGLRGLVIEPRSLGSVGVIPVV